MRIPPLALTLSLSACAPEGGPAVAGPPDGLARLLPADWSAEGDLGFAKFGTSVAFADVDGDGIDDLLVGAPNDGDGRASLYRGSPNGLAAAPSWTARPTTRTDFGRSVASAGDVNGDGRDDVLVTSSTWTADAAVELYVGAAGGLGAAPAWTVAPGLLGFGAALGPAGDVNGDGFDDVVIGSTEAVGGPLDGGAVEVYLGSRAGLGAAPAQVVRGDAAAQIGSAVAVGDVNGDGLGDLVVTSEWYEAAGSDVRGAVYVHFGDGVGFSPTPDATLLSETWGRTIGRAAFAGDVDGDGFGDLVVTGFERGDPTLARDTESWIFPGSAAGPTWRAAWTLSTGGPQVAVGGGDLDGDGFADLVVGEPTAGVGGDPHGAAHVYLGSAAGLSRRPLVSTTSDDEGSRLGDALALGDTNGDGLDDLAVAAPQYTSPETAEGVVFVHLGRSLPDTDGDGVVDPQDVCVTVPDLEQLDADGDGVGNACDDPSVDVAGGISPGEPMTVVASGLAPGEVVDAAAVLGAGGVGPCSPAYGGLCLDLGAGALPLGSAAADARGVAVIAATAPANLPPGGPLTIQVAVARGAGGASSAKSAPRTIDGARIDWDLDGLVDDDEGALGSDPTLVDSDGDGLSDGDEATGFLDPVDPDSDGDGADDAVDVCLAGDDALDPDGDRVPSACDQCPADADPLQPDADGDGLGNACEGAVLTVSWTAEGDARVAYFGSSVASGDVNGDGFGDVIVGAHGATLGERSEGSARVYLGSAAGLAAAPVWTGQSNSVGAIYGYSTAAADVNGDGYDDVIVGAPYTSITRWGEGQVHLYLGSAAGPRAAVAWRAPSGREGALLGNAVARAGDVNGDGFEDVLVGAPGLTNGQPNEGGAFLFLGSPAGLSRPAWQVEGDAPYAALGRVAGAGDVNGDGFDDVLVGSADRGTSSLYLGSSAGPDATPVWTTTAGGEPAGAGDVDGDGFDDVIVGSYMDDGQRGSATLFLGSFRGLEPTPSVVLPGAPDSRHFGLAVAAAGDVNGDGYGDVVIGDPSFDGAPYSLNGRAVVHLGSAEGLAGSAAWVETARADTAYFGSAVAGAGDVDGDGFDDLIVGAWGFSGPQADEGAAKVYRGRRP